MCMPPPFLLSMFIWRKWRKGRVMVSFSPKLWTNFSCLIEELQSKPPIEWKDDVNIFLLVFFLITLTGKLEEKCLLLNLGGILLDNNFLALNSSVLAWGKIPCTCPENFWTFHYIRVGFFYWLMTFVVFTYNCYCSQKQFWKITIHAWRLLRYLAHIHATES